jgi:hypothetical protein
LIVSSATSLSLLLPLPTVLLHGFTLWHFVALSLSLHELLFFRGVIVSS